QHLGTAARRGQRGGAVSTAEVEHLEPRLHAEALDHRLTALAHALRDAGEVALLPECLVRIHASRSYIGFSFYGDLADSAVHRMRAGRRRAPACARAAAASASTAGGGGRSGREAH